MSPFEFPIRKADGKPFSDAEQLHRLLESESSGHYLLSKSGYWHGGIHLSDESAPHCVYNEPVRCIADGEVVAYRLNKDYLTSQIGPDTEPLQYSTSFCLVRHKYQSPPNPEEGPNHGKQNELTFYSLYMHLLPYERYPNTDPAYDNRVQINFGDRAARNVPMGEPGSKKIGMIRAGTHFDILEEREGAEGYRFSKGRVVEAYASELKVGDEIWFASHKDGLPITYEYNQPLLTKVQPPERVQPAYWRGVVTATVYARGGLEMYLPPNDNYFGDLYGPHDVLPYDYRFSFDNEQIRLFTPVGGVTRPVAPCTSGVAAIRREPIRQTFWAFVDDQMLRNPRVEPARLDTVIVPTTPIPIKAGDPVGYLGLYETPAGAGKKTKHQVHLEVFTCDPNLEAFLNNEAGLKQGKQYLHVPKLAPTVLGLHTQSEFRSYLFQEHVFDLKKLPIERKDGEEFYKASVQEKGPGQGAPIRHLEALISKQSPSDPATKVRIVSQHDLKALGFKVVQQHQRDSCSPLNNEQVCGFYRQLNALADANHDGKISADELRQTLKNPEFRDRWSKLIVLHHTEWQSTSDSAKWQPMRDRLSNNPERWRHESERIDQSVFWDEVAEKVGLPADGRVSYFHPVEFVGALTNQTPKITVDMLKQVFEGLKNTYEKDSLLQEMANQINDNSEKYKLDTRLRLSHFFAQVRQEVGAKCKIEEDFTYSPQGLKGTFRYFRENPNEATLYGYGATSKFVSRENQIAIGNRAYGSKFGNGDIVSGDGWRFRGRGLKHLTFKSNYEAFGNYHRDFWDEDTDFVANPDLLHSDYKYVVRSGVYFWVANRLFLEADEGSLASNVDAITRIINRNTDSYEARKRNFVRIYEGENIFEDF